MGNTQKRFEEQDQQYKAKIIRANMTEPHSHYTEADNVRPINNEVRGGILHTANQGPLKAKIITVFYHAQDHIKIELPLDSDILTLGWFINEVERKIKEEKFFDITSQLFKDKRIVALKCKTSKSECMDYLLSLPHSNINFLQDRDILETVNACTKQKRKRKPHLEDFDFLKVIGKGGFSNVFHVRRKDDGTIHAMKCLKKSQIKRENKVRHVMAERQILSQVVHPFIVKMEWAFQTEHYLFMVLEFCAGGEIFYHMNKVQRFSEKVAKFYFAEILLAIEYLHNNNIFYRDLKPENILLDEEGHVKLADFGISRINFSERDRSTSFCGSPEYMSPEMLKEGRVHGRSVDFYALGALLYEMLTGLPPHFSENREEMYRRILHGIVEYPRYLSPMAKSLLKGLLLKNPDQRLGARFGVKEIRDHPFCRDIDWQAVIEKRVQPPIKPSLRYSNFDPDYTSIPVRFTFEEDLVRSNVSRRKSDPGFDNYLAFSQPNQIAAASVINPAYIYPNFAFERRGDISSKGSNNTQGIMMSQQLVAGTGGELTDDQPEYSRPPSSTFRGYSFMNFRNDSVSSVDVQNTLSEVSQKVKDRPSQTTLNPTQGNNLHATHILAKPIQSNIFNIIDDYQFTSSQRSRTISFANQSMLTEGIEQKNIYAMDFHGFNNFFNEICFKSNEFEFNSFNHQLSKKVSYPLQYKTTDQRPFQSFIGQTPLIKPTIPQQIISQEVLYEDVMNNFEFTKDQQPTWAKQLNNMTSIQEDAENEALNSRKITKQDEKDPEDSQIFKSKPQSELHIDKVTSKLIENKDASLNKYAINLIRFNDEINNVKSERKRKINPVQQLKDTVSQNRKNAHSLYTNENPLSPETRVRVESNYTTRSGGGNVMDVSQDRYSNLSSKKKFLNKKSKVYQKPPSLGIVRKQSSKQIKSQTGQISKLPSASHFTSQSKQQLPSTNKFGNKIISPKNSQKQQTSTSTSNPIVTKPTIIDNTKSNQNQFVSPKISTKKLYEEKKTPYSTIQTTNSQTKKYNEVQNSSSAIKSRNYVESTKKYSNSVISNQEKKNINSLKQGQLEQIDEFDGMAILTKEQMSKTIVQTSTIGSSIQGIYGTNPRKKLSRLNSPKSEFGDHFKARVSQYTSGSKPPTSTNNTRNRMKTNSHYVQTPSHNNEFKNLFAHQPDSNKKTPGQDPGSGRSKNRIPKSQEREKKSSSENTLEDCEDNVDEFKQGENYRLMKLKNPSLMNSIAINSNKHVENSKDLNAKYSSQSASSSIISHYETSTQRTPEQMRLEDLTVKASPQQMLGQADSFLETNSSQNLKLPNNAIQATNRLSVRNLKNHEDEDQNKQTHSYSKSGQQAKTQTPLQKLESPKLQSLKKGTTNINNNASGRYSFWNTKRNEQKTPSDSGKQQIIKTEQDSQEFEEVKVGERICTEVKGSLEDKMLLSKSESKFKKVNKPQAQQSQQQQQQNKQIVPRLTISQANKNI